MITVDVIVSRLLAREGGYVNRAEDRGGPTNFGITLTTLGEWRGAATAADIKALTIHEARAIYLKRYITEPRYILIDDPYLAELTIDTGVNNGRARATLWLQRAAGVIEDGAVGPATLAAVNSDSERVYRKLCALRIQEYGRLIEGNHSQAVFAAGWLNRVAEFVARR